LKTTEWSQELTTKTKLKNHLQRNQVQNEATDLKKKKNGTASMDSTEAQIFTGQVLFQIALISNLVK